MTGTRSIARQPGRASAADDSACTKAIGWLSANRLPRSGIVPYAGQSAATQEVTGYLIATLFQVGERDLALDLARWEMSVQRPDGAFTAVDGVPYTFDTAQVARGLLAVLDDLPDAESSLRRACDFVVTQIDREGRVHTPSYAQWRCADGGTFSEYTDLYILPPMMEAGRRLCEPRYVEAAERALEQFKTKPDLTEFKPQLETLSHIFGYMMEALAELGEHELVRKGLAQAAEFQRADGAIPAYPGAQWVCSTGVAQLALAWYRIGHTDRADAAMTYLESIQNTSGGFYGGYGRGVEYFAGKEISWAVKFFLDGLMWKSRPRDADDHRQERTEVR